MRWLLGLALVLIVAVSSPSSPPAAATFPGGNGLIAVDFTVVGDPGWSILGVDPVTGESIPITERPPTGTFGEIRPSWSASGEAIAFHRDGQIWMMDKDGGAQIQVSAFDEPVGAHDTAWSPDGCEIAFEGSIGGLIGLFALDLRTGEVRTIAPEANAGVDGGPSWSPDGKRIAFTKGQGIWLVDSQGSDPPVELLGARGSNPSWSPDGRAVAYAGWDDNETGQIAVVSLTGEVTMLTNTNTGLGRYSPAWSPDGTRIAFIESDNPNTSRIMVMKADGSGVTTLLDDTMYGFLDWQPRPAMPPPPCLSVDGLPAGGGPPPASSSPAALSSIGIGAATIFTALFWIVWHIRRSTNQANWEVNL